MTAEPAVDLEKLTDAQMRRAMALLLVQILYPHASLGVSNFGAAKWIVTGKLS
jgi:hypothetical protein